MPPEPIYSIMGGADIHVPHGVQVERTGFSLMGGDSIEPADQPPPPGAPVIHLHSVNVMGGNDVKRGPRSRAAGRGSATSATASRRSASGRAAWRP